MQCNRSHSLLPQSGLGLRKDPGHLWAPLFPLSASPPLYQATQCQRLLSYHRPYWLIDSGRAVTHQTFKKQTKHFRTIIWTRKILAASAFLLVCLPVPGLCLCCIVDLFLLPDVLFIIIEGLNPLLGTGLEHSCVSLRRTGWET